MWKTVQAIFLSEKKSDYKIVCIIYSSLGTQKYFPYIYGFPGGTSIKSLLAKAGDTGTQVQSLGQKDPLEEGMATHSSILSWRISRTEGPGRLQSMGSQRV